jgi:hypothetical protein
MDRMAREIEHTELDRQIGQELERVDWWVDTVKSLAEPIPDYEDIPFPGSPFALG